ncbi:MAG TPA: hypothetical protein VML55_10805 [Planctomycetaceae bacterium]|nr:hypothetical protein [Planctomycetaceae bacterium]
MIQRDACFETMDMTDKELLGIVHALSAIWHRLKSPAFPAYLESMFGREASVVDSSIIRCVYIAHALEGDLDAAQIGAIICGWWRVSGAGIEQIRRPDLLDCQQPPGVDPTPVIKFHTDGTRITIGERYGPTLVCRKAGRVPLPGQWFEELNVVWVSKTSDC